MLSKFSTILGIAGLVGIAWIQYVIVNNAYNSGFETCRAQYQERLLIQKIEQENKERALNEELGALSNELVETRLQYENTITNLKSEYDSELLKSKQRAELYQRYSQSDKAKQRDLTNYTAQLDRSLTEGRELVRQLTETLRTRDTQLRALGVYIEQSSKLYERETNELEE